MAQTTQHAAAVEKGRSEGDKFLGDYFLARRTAYSTLLAELVAAADDAKIKPKEHAYATEPIEGSDALSMMTITANYEGTYANLMRFVHVIDRSPRMLIIEALNAAPEQGNANLAISMKIDAFVRDDGRNPRGGARGMKLLPAGLGAEPKKLAILVALLGVLIVVFVLNRNPSSPASEANSPGVRQPAPPSAGSAQRAALTLANRGIDTVTPMPAQRSARAARRLRFRISSPR